MVLCCSNIKQTETVGREKHARHDKERQTEEKTRREQEWEGRGKGRDGHGEADI